MGFFSVLILDRGEHADLQCPFYGHFHQKIYILIHKNFTTRITHEICLSECISTQANILHAKGKDGENKQSKAADGNQKEHVQSFF